MLSGKQSCEWMIATRVGMCIIAFGINWSQSDVLRKMWKWQLRPNDRTGMNPSCKVHIYIRSPLTVSRYFCVSWRSIINTTFCSAAQDRRRKTWACVFTPRPYLGKIPWNNVWLALPHIAVRPDSHPPCLACPVPQYLYYSNFEFTLSEGDSLREAAVPQWSTTSPLCPSLSFVVPLPLRPPPPPPPLTRVNSDAGVRGLQAGLCWGPGGARGMSSHGRYGAGARRLIAPQSANWWRCPYASHKTSGEATSKTTDNLSRVALWNWQERKHCCQRQGSNQRKRGICESAAGWRSNTKNLLEFVGKYWNQWWGVVSAP